MEHEIERQNDSIAELKRQLELKDKVIISIDVDKAVLQNQNRKLEESVNFYKKFELDLNKLKCITNDSAESLRDCCDEIHFIENIEQWGEKTLSSFTGMQHYSSVEFLITTIEAQTKERHTFRIKMKYQVLLFLMKLRLGVSNKVIAKLFNISSTSVSSIFRDLLYIIHKIYYGASGPLSSIPTRQKTELSLPKCFKNEMSNCRIVIDCTEFSMEAPKLMSQKKITYSSYKGRHTMKSLICCAPNGVPVFVSDLFGGSESDKSIVQQSRLLEQMLPGDLILADKGFEIYDILPDGVCLNIPSFLTKSQFTLNETIRNRAISRARIIVERLNARFKVFKILSCIKAGDRTKANRLVKVCVAITTLMPTLMDELNNIE